MVRLSVERRGKQLPRSFFSDFHSVESTVNGTKSIRYLGTRDGPFATGKCQELIPGKKKMKIEMIIILVQKCVP